MEKIVMAIMAAGLSGCLVSAPTTIPNGKAAAQVDCSNPRPMVCTMEYRPVCASLLAGGEKTYASGCNACADIAVSGYLLQACEDQQ